MHEKIFPKATIEAKHRGGMLGAHFDCFLSWMSKRSYSCNTMRAKIQSVTLLGEYLERKGIRCIRELQGKRGQRLLSAYQDHWKSRGCWRRSSTSRFCMRALEEAGVIKTPTNSDRLLFPEVSQYVAYLKSQRGLSESTIGYHKYWTERLLGFLGCREGASLLPTFQIADIDRFIEREGTRLQCGTQQLLAGVLRSFLHYLYLSGELITDLSCFVASPRRYKLQSLPGVLEWEDVQKIIDSVDLSTRAGPQHYAILLFLTTYGLRAGEVARLTLDDIDWRKETIHIAPGKTGRDLWLPLTAGVGKAILAYLKDRRPSSKYREIFLLTCAPWTPLKSGNIAYVVNRHIKLAGLDPPRHGPHLLRHSFATRLIRAGASLKEIGDLLGHRDPESTHTYTKTATDQLREVALEIPEVDHEEQNEN